MTRETPDYRDRIVVDPGVLVGKPAIKGTRIPVSLILNLLAHGYTVDRVLAAYPDLTEQGVRAVILYSAARVDREEIMVSSPIE
jgi:uncharacterized protein (DUF433 family)